VPRNQVATNCAALGAIGTRSAATCGKIPESNMADTSSYDSSELQVSRGTDPAAIGQRNTGWIGKKMKAAVNGTKRANGSARLMAVARVFAHSDA
jgi:hypothetical protein